MNISSIIIKTTDKYYSHVFAQLTEADFCEIHFYDDNKIVVTIEGDSTSEEISKLKKIESIKGVVSAEMVFAYSEDELEIERKKIEFAEDVPQWLNDETVKAEQIKYKGDLKKKI